MTRKLDDNMKHWMKTNQYNLVLVMKECDTTKIFYYELFYFHIFLLQINSSNVNNLKILIGFNYEPNFMINNSKYFHHRWDGKLIISIYGSKPDLVAFKEAHNNQTTRWTQFRPVYNYCYHKSDVHDIHHLYHNLPLLIHMAHQLNSIHCHNLPRCWDCILGFQLKWHENVPITINKQ